MNTFELNKIAGAILASGLVVVAINEIANIAVAPTHLEEPAYVIDTGAETATADSGDKAESGPSLGVLLAAADPAKGEKVFKKCASCHTAEEGGANKIGPNLYNILNNPKAAHEGFSYSNAMVEHGGEWSYEDLNQFLTNPKGFISGTKMSFAGIKKDGDRADLIAYLRTLGKEDVPLPAAE